MINIKALGKLQSRPTWTFYVKKLPCLMWLGVGH